jgi:DNA-binding MarR family transcriptional regulator
LARRGLVTRKRSETSNREVTVTLSANGRAIIRKLVPVARALESKAAGSLPASDIAELRRLLRAVFDNLTRK